MSKINFQNRVQGHRVEAPSNRDLQQKLTYQQLLNLNHDLSKENQQLKNMANRLGQELRSLHTQFDIRPRDQNNQLYNAIGAHPILHQYQLTLIPLLDAYEAKIQQFQSGFETINQEFINLQKKYIQVSSENQRLRTDLTDKIKQLVEVYQTSSSEKLGADFSQIILGQINQKQKFLSEENGKLEREYQKYRSQSEKLSRELTEIKRKEQDVSSRFKQLEITNRQAEGELKSLKEQNVEGQMKINQLGSERKKLQNDIQRAMSQVAQLNKERDGILKNYDTLKKSYERDISQAQEMENIKTQNWQKRPLEETRQQVGDDSHKKLAKLQKDYDNINREHNKKKEDLEQYRVAINQLNQRIAQIKRKLQTAESQKRAAEMSETKNKKLLEQFTEKNKFDSEKSRRLHEDEIKKVEDDFYAKLEKKQEKITKIEEELDKVRLQKDKMQQENIIHTTLAKDGSKVNKGKQNQRAVDKLHEKLKINDELFKEQLQIIENDNTYLKRESQNYKTQLKDKSQELRKLKQDLQKVRRQLGDSQEKQTIIIQEIKRVKIEYEGSLRDKERIFEQKIKQIKAVIQETEKKRKSEREKVAEASRQYKRVLQEMRNTYQERIHVLEGEAGYGFKAK